MLELMHNDYFKAGAYAAVDKLREKGIHVDDYDETKYPIVEWVSSSDVVLSLEAFRSDRIVQPMKSDEEIFGTGEPMGGALAIGGSASDDELAPKVGKMKVADKNKDDKNNDKKDKSASNKKKDDKEDDKKKDDKKDKSAGNTNADDKDKSASGNKIKKFFKFGSSKDTGGEGSSSGSRPVISSPIISSSIASIDNREYRSLQYHVHADSASATADAFLNPRNLADVTNAHRGHDDEIMSDNYAGAHPLTDVSNSRSSPGYPVTPISGGSRKAVPSVEHETPATSPDSYYAQQTNTLEGGSGLGRKPPGMEEALEQRRLRNERRGGAE